MAPVTEQHSVNQHNPKQDILAGAAAPAPQQTIPEGGSPLFESRSVPDTSGIRPPVAHDAALAAARSQLEEARDEADSLRRELQACQYSERVLRQHADESDALVAELQARIDTMSVAQGRQHPISGAQGSPDTISEPASGSRGRVDPISGAACRDRHPAADAPERRVRSGGAAAAAAAANAPQSSGGETESGEGGCTGRGEATAGTASPGPAAWRAAGGGGRKAVSPTRVWGYQPGVGSFHPGVGGSPLPGSSSDTRDRASVPVPLDGRVLSGLHPADLDRLCSLTERNLHEIRAAIRRTHGRMRALPLSVDRGAAAAGSGGGSAGGGWAGGGGGGAGGGGGYAGGGSGACDLPPVLVARVSADGDDLAVVGGRAQCTARPPSSSTSSASARRGGEGRNTPTGLRLAAQPRTPGASAKTGR